MISKEVLERYQKIEEDYSWLELPSLPETIVNPLLDTDIPYFEKDPVKEMIEIMTRSDYLHFTCQHLLNFNLLPFQAVILDILWNKRFPMMIATRGGGKTTMFAVYILLRLVLSPGCKIVAVGSGFRQSREIWERCISIWDDAPVLRDIAGTTKSGPKREVDRCEFRIGKSIAYFPPIGNDGQQIRGLRANYVLIDEMASVNKDILENVIQGFAAVSKDPVEKVKRRAMLDRLSKSVDREILEQIERQYRTDVNQIIYAGTAYFAFNHFYDYFDRWRRIIRSKGDPNKLEDIFGSKHNIPKGFNHKDFAVVRIPYDDVPAGFLDEGFLSQAQATMATGHFQMELGACFLKDTNGFYKRSTIERATTHKPVATPSGEVVQFSVMKTGDADKFYVMGIDPAADADNAAITILEVHNDHRRVVYCWTTNKNKFRKYMELMKERGVNVRSKYYEYIADKVRELMSRFRIEAIIMDKHGGGTAIAECLSEDPTSKCKILPVVDPDKPKQEDEEEGLHILTLIAPTNDINSEANHGMSKDLETFALLFPKSNIVESARLAVLEDIESDSGIESYSDVVSEIEDLKREMTTIVCTPSATLGKETFDVPKIKESGSEKGRLRKDRYSSLLYANYYCRTRNKEESYVITYTPMGGTRDSIRDSVKTIKQSGGMYTGLGQGMSTYSGPPVGAIYRR